MAKAILTTRPYIFSSAKTNLFLNYFPLLSNSSKDTFLAIKNHLNPSLFSSSTINKPVNNNGVVSKTRPGILGHRRFSIKATHFNDPGSFDSPLMQSMEKKIKEHLNAESVTVKDASGDGRHVCIDVVSSAFEGQSAVNRQRMVYKTIWEELQNTVHAVDQMSTRTPDEVASQK
ncbi:Protein BOLA4 [Hibiscus syriacus]|uniref:Protein BOLA4 n=1 Tax=Hibiscus syriacus TaxID=106335 RepID=A0A6A3C384_HIBSY|nr:protein BOLA4, chloroplastic/mitochondrial-like [Hibiscus syriacus]KAE8723413.1 Protein BOLA4 [Hibiscus syriacus]